MHARKLPRISEPSFDRDYGNGSSSGSKMSKYNRERVRSVSPDGRGMSPRDRSKYIRRDHRERDRDRERDYYRRYAWINSHFNHCEFSFRLGGKRELELTYLHFFFTENNNSNVIDHLGIVNGTEGIGIVWLSVIVMIASIIGRITIRPTPQEVVPIQKFEV